jgi:hypothetical protein
MAERESLVRPMTRRLRLGTLPRVHIGSITGEVSTMNARRLLPLLAVAALAAAATPAHAGQFVYSKNGSLWAMNDDGSNQHVIANWADVPDTRALDDPSVQRNGTLVAFTAEWAGIHAEEIKWIPSLAGAGGVNSLGVYRLRDGAATRLTKPPFGCPLAPCAQTEDQPDVANDGRVYYETNYYQWDLGFGYWELDTSAFGIGERDAAAGQGDGAAFADACQGQAGRGRFGPAANPTNPAEIAYSGCSEGLFGPFDIDVSGANPSSAADDVVLGNDDERPTDLSWTPDGTHLLDAEGGNAPGLWTMSVDPSNLGSVWMVDMRTASSWGSPHVLDDGRVAFDANGSLWTVPARCRSGSASAPTCAFPADATLLVAGADDQFGWTSSNQPITPLAHVVATGGGTSVTPAPKPIPQPTPKKVTRTLMSLKLSSATVRKGIRLVLRLRKAAKIKVTLAKLHANRSLGSANLRGRTGTNLLVIRTVGGHRLKRGSYRVTLKVGSDPARKLTVRVR